VTQGCPVCGGALVHRRTVGDHDEYRCTGCGRDWTTDASAGREARVAAPEINHWPSLGSRRIAADPGGGYDNR
jgi:transposase-like protein